MTFDQAYAKANAERAVELDDFKAGWDAALVSPDALYTMDQMRDYADNFHLSSMRVMVAEKEAYERHAPQSALADAVDLTIKTLVRQLDLIAERAPGNYLDKTPVIRSLQAHKQRLERAIEHAAKEKA